MDPGLIKSVVDRAERERLEGAQEAGTDETVLRHARRVIESSAEEARYYAALLSMLEKKEDDVRLAAHLGESLIKENAKLRAAGRERESLGERYTALEAELMSSRDKIRSLERRLEISTSKLDEADELVQTLQNEVQKLQSLKEKAKNGDSIVAPEESDDATDGGITPIQATAPSWSELADVQDKAHIDEVNQKLQEDLDRLTKKDKANEEEKAELQRQIAELTASHQSVDLEMKGIRKQLSETQVEKTQVADDLAEAMEIIREASTNQEDGERHVRAHGTSIDDEVKESEGNDVDIYFFHFHMLAMSIKAKTVHAHPDMPKELLEEMNKLNLKQLYHEVLEHGVPPHDWYQYIYDLYASVQLQALMRSNSINRVYTAGPSTPLSAAKTNSVGKTNSTKLNRKSSFTRFIGAMSDRLLSSPSTKLHPQTPASPF